MVKTESMDKTEKIKGHKHFIEITAYLCGILDSYNATKFTTTLENVYSQEKVLGNYKITIEKLSDPVSLLGEGLKVVEEDGKHVIVKK